jgi:hypothetical protein
MLFAYLPVIFTKVAFGLDSNGLHALAAAGMNLTPGEPNFFKLLTTEKIEY